MKKGINPVICEKIDFIKNNSHILINILNNRMSTENSVLETVASIIISDKALDDFEDIDELKMIIELNEGIYKEREKENRDDSDSYGVIFSVAQYVNSTVLDEELNNEIRNRLRLYTSSFNKDRTFSESYSKFISVKKENIDSVLKKI